MASFSVNVGTVSRASGKSAVAAAAYRCGGRLTDERTGLLHDYTRKGGVLHSEIVTPSAVPIWAGDRQRLWNEAEKAEDKSTRRDIAKTARDFRMALPHELSEAVRLEVTREFSRFLVDRYGAAVDFAIHAPDRGGDQRNHHAHVLLTARQLGPDGFGAKLRLLDSPKTSGPEIVAIRAEAANIGANALASAGFALEADRYRESYRSLPEQRAAAIERGDIDFAESLDREATIHLGVAATNMERDGEPTELGDINRDALARNAERDALKAEAAAIEAQIIDLAAERAKRAEERDMRAAVRTFDPARVLDQITAQRSTFTRADLNYALSKEITDAKERAAMNDTILSRPEVIGLRETAEGPVIRYTTRAVLNAERDVLSDAATMAQDSRHGLTDRQQAEALDYHPHLDREQRAAFDHATGPEGFAVIAGEAGTGKSSTMAAVRDAYELAGHRVIGMSWTNAVVEDMRRDGFGNAATVASELFRLEHGRTRWDSHTVLIVDEAAMLATKHLAAVAAHAEAAGAKVILVGDDRQLPSIERGGMFGALKEEHGAAELHVNRRVSAEDEKIAWGMMHRREFRPALEIFDQRGAIRWNDTPENARADLVSKYRTDLENDPGKTRFAFAYTNAEVRELNSEIRTMQRERGALGPDHRLETKEGPQDFATGDRVQFTANATTRAERAAGFINGEAGTVRAIDGERMTVELDGGKAGKPRLVSFNVSGEPEAGNYNAVRHGYAGTIYKGQGKTLDQTYLLHSKHWRETSSYVALTRHRDGAAVFVAKDTTRDIDQLARQMARVEDRRSASQFHHDAPERQQGDDRPAGFPVAAREATGRPEAAKVPAEPQHVPTARQQAEAQRKAAIIGRIKDPAKVAMALRKAHLRDAAGEVGRSDAAPPVRRQSALEALAEVDRAVAKDTAREASRPDFQPDRERSRGRTR